MNITTLLIATSITISFVLFISFTLSQLATAQNQIATNNNSSLSLFSNKSSTQNQTGEKRLQSTIADPVGGQGQQLPQQQNQSKGPLELLSSPLSNILQDKI